jgi:hypothetical protein
LIGFYLVLAFVAAAFRFFQTSRILRLRTFFCAAVIDRIFVFAAADAVFAEAAGFAAWDLFAAQISRILCAWAFRSAGVRVLPLWVPADGTSMFCRIPDPVPVNSA